MSPATPVPPGITSRLANWTSSERNHCQNALLQKLRARLAEVVAERDEAQLALTGARESLATRTRTLALAQIPNPEP